MGNKPIGYWILVAVAIVMAIAGFVVRSSPDPQKHAMAQYLGWGAIALLLIARFFFRRKPDPTPPITAEKAVLVSAPQRPAHDQEERSPGDQFEYEPKSEITIGLRFVFPPSERDLCPPCNHGIKQDETEAAEQIKEDERQDDNHGDYDHNNMEVVREMNGTNRAQNIVHIVGKITLRHFARHDRRAKIGTTATRNDCATKKSDQADF
jgi:hypothetical protein